MSNVRFFELVDYLTSYMSNWFTDDPTDAEMTDSYDGEAAAEAWRDEWRHLTDEPDLLWWPVTLPTLRGPYGDFDPTDFDGEVSGGTSTRGGGGL